MNDFDMFAAAWCRTGWTLLLVFTAAVLLVAALRKPMRKAFGAERAFLLWLLPVLAMPASLLPHAAATTASLPPIALKISRLPSVSYTAAAGAHDWRIWGGGALACGCRQRVGVGRVRATALLREIARSGCVHDGSSTLAGHARE